MYKNKKGGIIGIVITIIVLILLVILTNIENSNLSYIENIANKLVNPIQNGLTYVKNKIHGNSSFFSDINNLKEENKELQEKNDDLEETLRELETIKAENETLKEYLNLTEKYSDYETVAANVISRDISNYSKTIVINVGSKSGIEENMTVIASGGLVGYVVSVTSTTSKVQTIIDSSSNTSSILSSSRDSVVCKGILDDDTNLKAVYIPTDANIAQDDSVETSGLGGIYPKGLYIGKVSKVINTNNLTDRYAMIETGVDFNKLETVLVITNQ
jgi:rod shape-determining protein MreC